MATVKDEIKDFKEFWKKSYSQDLTKAPKSEIASALWNFLKINYQVRDFDLISKEEGKALKKLSKKGLVEEKGRSFIVPLADKSYPSEKGRRNVISNIKHTLKGKGWIAKSNPKEFGYYASNTHIGKLLEHRKADCNSFTHLYMKIGKEVGLEIRPIAMERNEKGVVTHVAPEVVIGTKKVIFDPILKEVRSTKIKFKGKKPTYLSEQEMIKSQKQARLWQFDKPKKRRGRR